MKIGASIGLAQQAAVSRSATGSTTGSFAAMIASGRSVDSIRSERAFGFSETGLFGAARILKQEGGKAPELTAGNAHAESNSKSSRIDPTLRNRLKSDVPTQSGKAKEFDARSVLASIERPKAAEALAYLAPSRSGSLINARAIQFTKQRFNIQHFTCNTESMFKKRKSSVVVSGPEDALSVTVGPVDLEHVEQHALISAFFSTVRQYSMTLASIRLSNY